ncbi:PAS domain-containing protein [Scytonema sp. UIC 10036]|uniref:PAS domain-containing protein n=1 Tax=Scytonema sp. UIC 10036 TaxID=2304196 RepID=UPI0012DA627D|nr:PAS domain-containing protein [Scytonema sp. UIC 10036]MUG96700.1 PAS domain-containing protein [Scytonema sp. UIC 10036]
MCKCTELEKINQQLTLALESANMGIWDWNLLTDGVIWSIGHERLFGLSPGTFLGTYDAVMDCIHPDDREKVTLASYQACTFGYNFHQEFRVIWPDGSIHWMESKGKCIYNNEAQAVRMLGTVMEITERKQAELALKESEERFRLLAETIQDVFWIANATNSQVLYVSSAYEKIWGRQSESLYANSQEWIDSIHPEERESVKEMFSNQILEGDLEREYRIVLPDGTVRWIQDRAYTIKDELGEVQCLVGIAQDISDRKQVEATLQQLNEELEMRVQQRTYELETSQATLQKLYQQLQAELYGRERVEIALRRSENLFRSLCEFAPVGIFKADPQGKNIYSNPCCQSIGGFTLEEALGDGWMQFIHPEDLDNIVPQWKIAIALPQKFSCEFRALHGDGTIRFCQMKSVPIIAELGELLGHVGTIEDITECRAIEKMKNEFISIVSHELRTPLASIRGSLGLLAAGVFNEQPEIAQQMLVIATSDTERLVRLVDDILDLERLESNTAILVKQQCDAGALMQQSVKTLQPLAIESHITVSILPASIQIWADPDQILQTLINLVANAIKFSLPNSQVILSAEDLPDCVLFKVQDWGRGIPQDKLEVIFERFQQLDASDSRQKGGTGLGLAICRGIVQQHGGKIWAESVLGKGSIFYFTIPKLSQN